MKYFPKTNTKVTKWTGGSTREFYLFPENASLVERNFEWRISTATVEVEHSVFSNFNGYKRIIASLTNGFKISHPDQAISHFLQPFECYHFDGAGKTESKGIFQDFNVIYSEQWKAEVEFHQLTEFANLAGDAFRFYVFLEGLRLHTTEKTWEFSRFDLIQVEKGEVFQAEKEISCICISLNPI